MNIFNGNIEKQGLQYNTVTLGIILFDMVLVHHILPNFRPSSLRNGMNTISC